MTATWVRKDRRTGDFEQAADGSWQRALVAGVWHLQGPAANTWCGRRMPGLRAHRVTENRDVVPLGPVGGLASRGVCETCLIAHDRGIPRPYRRR